MLLGRVRSLRRSLLLLALPHSAPRAGEANRAKARPFSEGQGFSPAVRTPHRGKGAAQNLTQVGQTTAPRRAKVCGWSKQPKLPPQNGPSTTTFGAAISFHAACMPQNRISSPINPLPNLRRQFIKRRYQPKPRMKPALYSKLCCSDVSAAFAGAASFLLSPLRTTGSEANHTKRDLFRRGRGSALPIKLHNKERARPTTPHRQGRPTHRAGTSHTAGRHAEGVENGTKCSRKKRDLFRRGRASALPLELPKRKGAAHNSNRQGRPQRAPRNITRLAQRRCQAPASSPNHLNQTKQAI
jgi:hypothetical protein